MIFRNEAPVARVKGVMAIVALHPVIVHLEGILCGLLAVDEYLSITNLQLVALVGTDGAFVNGQVVECQLQLLAFLGNPDRTIVVTRPVLVAVQGVDVVFAGIGV